MSSRQHHRMMRIMLLLLVLPRGLRAEDGNTLPHLDRLAPLGDVPLPGETETETERPSRVQIEALVGKTIANVTSPNAPAGLDPVRDADIPLGIKLNRAIVRAAVRRLWDTGRYRDIRITARMIKETAVALFIHVEPMLRIGRLDIRGNKAIDSDEIEKALEYTPGRTIMPDPEVLRTLRRQLLEIYRQQGYREARAALSILTTEEAGRVELVVDITEGRPERYTRITVTGLPDDVTEQLLDIKKGTVRNKEVIDKKIERFLSKLAQIGYMDARCEPFIERRLSRYELSLTIQLSPGLKTEIAFEGNIHFLSRDLQDFLRKGSETKTDPETIYRKEAMLVEHLQTYGFLFAKVRATRLCALRHETIAKPVSFLCPSATLRQIVLFHLEEGPNVEVLAVLSDGNRWFSDRDLQEEVFAFITEKNANEEMFQPVDSSTINALGLSDKPIRNAPPERGLKATRYRRTRVYVPSQYLEVTSHLTGIYQEQGFLAAEVSDTCTISNRAPITYRGIAFDPLVIHRQDASSSDRTDTPCIYINRENKQLLVQLHIVEGAQTTISELTFEGNRQFSSQTLQETSGLAVSKPYNEYQLKQGARKLLTHYKSTGYMFAEVSFQKFFSEDMHRARVVYTIKEGPKARTGIIRIEGAETTAKKLIKEVISLEPGVVITPEEIDKSQMKLMDLGIFEGATVQMVSPEIPGPVKNIRIQVTEAKPQYLELRFGLATVEGVRSSFEYGFNNIAGWALNATLRARANHRLFFVCNTDFEQRYRDMDLTEQLEHHVLLGLGSPHILGTKGFLGWGIDAIKERINKPGFSASRFTTFLRLNSKLPLSANHPHGLVLFGRTGMEYNLDIESGQQLDNPYLQDYLRLPRGRSAFYVLGLNTAIDLRDSPFNPKEGFFLSIGADWVHSLAFGRDDNQQQYVNDPITIKESSNLIRAQATASGYVPVLDTEVVFAVSVTVGYIFHLSHDSTTWPDRYFYVGGIDTLRGFPEDALVPQDIYEEWKRELRTYGTDSDALLKNRGGESMLVTRAEIRYPLAKGFLGAIFGELGNLWRRRQNTVVMRFKPNFKLNLRPVAGVGIRYQTPLGPISFDLGVNLDRRPTELPVSWYISIGTAF